MWNPNEENKGPSPNNFDIRNKMIFIKNTDKINKEDLEEYAQIGFSVVGTEGAIENEFRIHNKKELLNHLNKLLPEKFGFSVIFGLDPREKGV